NGFAAWKLSSLHISNEKIKENSPIQVYFNSMSHTLFFSEAVKKADLFTIDGKLVQSATNVSHMNMNRKGVIIVHYKDQAGLTGTRKVIIP
ncbi:MAG: hypothetical protein LBG96_14895, partial [Tannerella sp.]|nr:hypothetical protein [Tannerella sp.]